MLKFKQLTFNKPIYLNIHISHHKKLKNMKTEKINQID